MHKSTNKVFDVKEVYREVMSWLADDKPETTKAIVEVSNFGNVRRLPYTKWNKLNKSYSSMRLKQYAIGTNRGKQVRDSKEKVEKCGLYQCVSVREKTYSVHRLVAEAFISKIEGKDHVNHIDGNRSNNHVSNLEWVSNHENVAHAWNTGMRTIENMQKITHEKIIEIARRRLNGESLVLIANENKLAYETIRLRVKEVLTNEQYNTAIEYDSYMCRLPKFEQSMVGIREAKNGYKLVRNGQVVATDETLDGIQQKKLKVIESEKNRIYSETLGRISKDIKSITTDAP